MTKSKAFHNYFHVLSVKVKSRKLNDNFNFFFFFSLLRSSFQVISSDIPSFPVSPSYSLPLSHLISVPVSKHPAGIKGPTNVGPSLSCRREFFLSLCGDSETHRLDLWKDNFPHQYKNGISAGQIDLKG